MNGLPYYPRYPRDFFDGTNGMTFELKGAYSMLLDLIYMSGGQLYDEPRFIAGHLNCSVRAWNGYRAALIEKGKISVDHGIISNFRADKELIIQRSFQDKQRINGSQPKKNKDLERSVGKPKSNHTDTDTDIRDDVDDRRDAVSPRDVEAAMPQARTIGQDEVPTLREQILTALGADPKSGIAGAGMFLGTQSDMHTVHRWQGELGLTNAEILGQISDVMSKARLKNAGFVPSRFTYFDRPMADFAGAKAAPQMHPTPYDGGRNGQYHNDESIRQPANRHGAVLTAGFAAVASRIGNGS